MGKGRSLGYPIRYKNPLTGVVSSNSMYIENGISKKINTHLMEYQINGKWTPFNHVPVNREKVKKYRSSKQGFFSRLKTEIRKRSNNKIKQKKEISGEYELDDKKRGCCDKLINQFDKQVERYGNKCPMTHIPFTMDITLERFDINNQIKIFSNISPDRIFNNINYTKQNTIFTSQLWNLKKGESPISELKFIFLPEVLERYKAIVIERFPDQEYVL